LPSLHGCQPDFDCGAVIATKVNKYAKTELLIELITKYERKQKTVIFIIFYNTTKKFNSLKLFITNRIISIHSDPKYRLNLVEYAKTR